MATKHKPKYKRIAQLKTSMMFREYMETVGADLPFDEVLKSPSSFGSDYTTNSGIRIGNRFCILPMEGWDGERDGKPSEYTRRRWKNFAVSGAKLLWGCEAVAVRHEGRANPNQLLINERNLDEFKKLHASLIKNHEERYINSDDLLIGLQLTHSGRFCKPNNARKMEPKILYYHPILNRKLGLAEDYPLMTDDDIDYLIEDFIAAAKLAKEAGFQFIDIKHCHGYLGHEFLSAVDREGRYGGSFENRTRFVTSITEGVSAAVQGMGLAVRLSAFDWIPFMKGENDVGVAESFNGASYPYAFGGSSYGADFDLSEPFKFLNLLQSLGIELVCTTAGSPYYNPHIQRPALFPPSDGYQPPEDPLVGVSRQIRATADIKKAFPDLTIVGSAYSYLQEWLPHVAQHVIDHDMADFIGLGRMVLSYPEMPYDVLKSNSLKRDRICRTFSDCTTAPRNGMISGCFPLDPFYKALPEAAALKEIKTA
jgi:2,4-dienoyl-CoA reductase-like NADH-dependent reductase (Old Yellow Enzyme family)